ncbi:MAG: glycoside hydrolase family 25 protein [Bacteroidaceae bacterium]|nr:glycoside hydrolase family 25 protein [Bacteroidaceae bacterium]
MSRKKRRRKIWKWTIGMICACLYVFVFYYFFVGPFGFRWHALFGTPDYPEGFDIHGIDISHHQGDIDWDALHNAMVAKCPLRFILVKATEGKSYVDPKFKENFVHARDYGYLRGAYHYLSTKSTAREQAEFFIKTVRLEEGDLPPVLDVEERPADMSLLDFQREVLTWLHLVEEHYGVKPILYTYYKFKENYLNDSRFDDYPFWIAHYYVRHLTYEGEWKFWQHTDAGQLPGIKVNVDLNVYNGSFYDLQQLTIKELP